MLRKITPFAALFAAAAFIPVAWSAEDATVSGTPVLYSPEAESLAVPYVGGGDVAEIDVQAVGNSLQYIGVVLNGDGADPNLPHLFLKVQRSGGSGFANAACYLGNNSSAGTFGLVFFNLTQQFVSAHMKAERIGSTVTLSFTNVDGGAKPDQVYVCNNAPPRPGDKIGINGFNNIATADNFSNGNTVLDDFSFVGTLASSGSWFDAASGMNAHDGVASGGLRALSFSFHAPAPAPASQESVDAIEAKADVLEAKADNLAIAVDTKASQASVNSLATAAAAIESKADALEVKADNLAIAVDTKASQASVNSLSTAVGFLESKADVLEGKADSLEVKADSIEAKIDGFGPDLNAKLDALEGKADALSTAVDDLKKCEIEVEKRSSKHFVLLLTVSGVPVAIDGTTTVDLSSISHEDDTTTSVVIESTTEIGAGKGLVHLEADESEDVKKKLLLFEVDAEDGDVQCSTLLSTGEDDDDDDDDDEANDEANEAIMK